MIDAADQEDQRVGLPHAVDLVAAASSDIGEHREVASVLQRLPDLISVITKVLMGDADVHLQPAPPRCHGNLPATVRTSSVAHMRTEWNPQLLLWNPGVLYGRRMTSGDWETRTTRSQADAEHPLDLTERTYDAIAEWYAERWNTADMASLNDARTHLVSAADSGHPILDVGCGTGRDLAWFSARGFQTIGVDRSSGMLRIAAQTAPEAKLMRGDARHLPLASESMGCWWACAVFVHFDATALRQALAETRRVTRPGGIGLLTVKEGSGSRLESVPDGPHQRYFHYWSDDQLDTVIHDSRWSLEDAWTAADSLGRNPWLTRLVQRH